MLKDEFRPIDVKVLTIGRSPKQKLYTIPKAVFDLPKKERAERIHHFLSILARWVKKITYRTK
ncbi:hypothetical protein PCY17_03990 [Streptococcus sp. SO2]|uniref:hypothetical protein n=1 Tax=Streptococcus sp. SO2 TaxID=3018248 RepID=UPI00263D8C50|nr:hypothetical protein [Streptococcus sp. SO2]MDN5014402.1 hypothetical protein [Streptococcus sp. SO2]